MGSFDSNERMRTVKAYNLHLVSESQCGLSGVPSLEDQDIQEPKKLIGFNYAKTMIDEEKSQSCCHFFLDDYQFERVWTKPEKYAKLLSRFDACLTPDFSLYTDMPLPLQQWNTYRSRLIGAYWQRCGLTVIPTLSWSTLDSFSFCFNGLDGGGTYAVSTIGIKGSNETLELFNDGLSQAIRRLKPSRIIEYGGNVGFDYGNIEVIRIKNQIIERFEHGRTRRSQL